MREKPELLLPAGNLEIAKLAIDHGADAVYVGLDQFSARAKAKNFSLEEMKDIIIYAHKHQAKIFCALNILLFNDELEEAIKAVATLVENNIDAFIVQDFGIATLILNQFPETEVHISTQMAIMNVSGVQTMEALGFDRVVLARETSLHTMHAMRSASQIDLEVFVQGALCVSYSGLCYMSSLQGDRSGNRGQCAQPCRTRYRLFERDTEQKETVVAENYLLSPKDMNLLEDLPALMDVPVQSLKIEGRMKQPEYVAMMADVYRKHIDQRAEALPADPEEMALDQRHMAAVFNREGFSSAYLHGTPGVSMMSLHTPKNTGVPLGKVDKINKKSCSINLNDALHTGDGVAFYDKHMQPIWGGYVETIKDIHGQSKKHFPAGTTVIIQHEAEARKLNEIAFCYKTFDKELSKKLLKPVDAKYNAVPQKGSLHLYVHAVVGAAFSVIALLSEQKTVQENDLSFQWVSDFVVESAQNGKSCHDVVQRGFEKVLNNGYRLDGIEMIGSDSAFVPMSIVTKAKNAIVAHYDQLFTQSHSSNEELELEKISVEEHIESCMEILDEIPPQIKVAHTPVLTVQVRTLSQARAAIEAGAEELNVLLVDTHRHDGLTVEEILVLQKEIPVLCSLPPMMKEPAEEKYYKKLCRQLNDGGIQHFMIANIGQAKLLDDLGIEYYHGDYQLNLTNDLTAAALSQIGLARQTISVELDGARMDSLSAIGTIPLELIIYGKLAAMNTRYCPMGSLVGKREIAQPCTRPCTKCQYFLEREGKRYEVCGDQFCSVTILNDKIYNLLPHLEAIHSLCLDYWRIAGAYMCAEDIRKIVATVRTLREQLVQKKGTHPIVPFTKNTTQGHFIKGVR